jgi:transcriptional regulator with GAF, ATPase, and Fis domain
MAIIDLIGSSGKSRALLDQINMVAPVNSAVLIQLLEKGGKRCHPDIRS